MKVEVGRVKPRTATIVLFILLQVSLVVYGHKTGICMKAGKTRTGRGCKGKLYTVTAEMSRVTQLPQNSQICRHHWDVSRRENLRCACPKQEHFRHSRLDTNRIPQRFYTVFDEVGSQLVGYRPGTRWCNLCKNTADEEFKEHRLYVSAARAKECDKESVTCHGEDDGKTPEFIENQLSSPHQLKKIWQFTGSPILCLHDSLKNDQNTTSESASGNSKLEEKKTHFKTLFTRLSALADICGIELFEKGTVTIDRNIWESMKEALEKENTVGSSFDDLVQRLQKALYHRYTKNDNPLYNPNLMKEFSETHAPGLYDLVLKSISREDTRLSSEYSITQEQRTVVLLHTLAYFRSQKTCLFQKDEGLFLQQHGTSRLAMNSGRVLGFSTSPRNIDNHKQQLISNYPRVLQQHITAAIKGQLLMVNLLDDFHNILTIRLPSELKLSVATHMASSLLDIHTNIHAVRLPLKSGSQHSDVKIKVAGIEKHCRGGIIVQNIKEMLNTYNKERHQHFFERMPSGLLIRPKNAQQQIKELRVYSELSHEELSTLSTTILIDEFEQSLKSMEDYQAAILHIFCQCPDLQNYLKLYVLPAPGDWPTWFYQKKLIAQCTNNSSILSIIPEQGPFHVFLNLQEDVIKMYHFMLGTLYHKIFGSDLPLKPKPYRINILINAIFLGWLKIRSKVLQKFKLCKDIEYVCLLHLLEEVIPLAFFHYSLIFRSGDLEGYVETMLRLLILFIIWKRKHYDKSTLSMLSDLWYQKQKFTDYFDLKKLWMTLITEKKVEIWHSMLRNNIQVYDKAQQIQSKATALAASKSEQNFQKTFVKPYSRGCSEKDMTIIAGKSAEVLLSTIKSVGKNLGKSKQVQQDQNSANKKHNMKYYLHTFDSTVDAKALPFAYTHGKSTPARRSQARRSQATDPDSTKVCDYLKCNITDSTSDAIRLPCFHTIHKSCFNLVENRCPICTETLDFKIKKLAKSFNESLLKPTSRSDTTDYDNSDDDDDDSSDDNIQVNNRVNPEYYSSSTWESQVDKELDTFTVPQPHNNITATSQQTPQSVPQPTPQQVNIQIAKVSLGSSRFCFLPPQLSQATLFGRNGSNACTFIALLLAKGYITSQQYAALQLDCNSDLNQTWLSLLLSAIARGNQMHDQVTQSQGLGNQFFCVAAAKHHLTAVIAPVTLEETLDLSIISVDPQIPQSSLAFYLQRLVKEQNLAALVIVNGMTVCFVGQGNKVYFMDSHPHNYAGRVFGAVVGMASVDGLEEFLINIKQQISPTFNVCSLSFASF